MLSRILDYKRLESEHRRRRVAPADVKLKARDVSPAISFFSRFGSAINVIAEVKKASPSAGVIRADFDPVSIAVIYDECGAKALSVLTDDHFFQGSLDNLDAIRTRFAAVVSPPPLLRKDFTVHEYDVIEARAHGADAVLLIVAALDIYQLKDYRQLAEAHGMTALVEVHDGDEWDIAIDSGAKAIGINNRNLKTFVTDIKTSADLLAIARPPGDGLRIISESGLKDRETLLDLREKGADGFLIGESLMRETDFGKKLRELIG